MVNAQTADLAGLHQFEDKLVCLFEDGRILHPDCPQGIDIEESAIVDLLGSDAPMGDAIDLIAKKRVQQIETARVASCAVESIHIGVNERPDCAAVLIQGPETTLDDLFFPVTFRDPLRVLLCGGRQVTERSDDAHNFLELWRLGSKLLLQDVYIEHQNITVGLGNNRQPVFVVVD